MTSVGAWVWLSLTAAGDPNPAPPGALSSPPPEIDPLRVTPGMWGFLSFLFMIAVAIVLYFSLRKQLKRVDFVEPPDDQSSTEGESTHAGRPRSRQ